MPGIFKVVFAAQLSLGLCLSTAESIDGKRKPGYSSVGDYAPLTNEGYQSVAAMHNDEEMKSFIRRLLQNGARTVTDESGLSGFVRYYSGTEGSQDLATMKRELSNPQKAWWVREGLGKTAPLSDDGLAQVVKLDDHVQIRAFLRRVVQSLEREVEDEKKFEGLAWDLPCTEGRHCLREVRRVLCQPGYTTEGPPVSAGEVPLDEDGYQRIAALKRNSEMTVFVTRVLASEGRSVKDPSGLSGFVPYYSGKVAVQDLATMKAELRKSTHAWWVDSGLGHKAPLTVAGFQSVLELRDGRQMKAFIRRLANPNGPMPFTEGELSGLVPYFSGEIGDPEFDALEKELKRLARRQRISAGHSMLSLKAVRGKDFYSVASLVELSERGYAEVAAEKDDAEMQAYIRRVVEREGRYVKSEFGLRVLAAYYSGKVGGARSHAALRKALHDPRQAWWLGNVKGRASSTGWRVARD